MAFLILFWPAIHPAKTFGHPAPGHTCRVIVVGYVGGLDLPFDPFSGVVQISDRLKHLDHPDLCVGTFSAFTWFSGYRWLVKKINTAENGTFFGQSSSKSNAPRIILYGHSLGGWATLEVARKLEHRNIPVELTVQIDSVGFTDATVPENVREAANYYRGAVLPPYGRREIRASNPADTLVLANVCVRHANHISVAQAPEISDLIVSKVEEFYSANEAPPSDANEIYGRQ